MKLLGTRSLVFLGQHICCRNHIASKVVSFYHMGTKVHINYICQPSKWSPMFNHWLTGLHNLCHINWKGLEMVDKMCNIFYLKHGRVCRNGVIKWIVWNHYHFLFLFGDKLLATARCFSWKTIFQKIEMDFWMYIWRHTSIVERLIFLCFFVFVGWQILRNQTLEVFINLLWVGWEKDTIWMSMCESRGSCLWNALFMNPWRTWYPDWERIAMRL